MDSRERALVLDLAQRHGIITAQEATAQRLQLLGPENSRAIELAALPIVTPAVPCELSRQEFQPYLLAGPLSTIEAAKEALRTRTPKVLDGVICWGIDRSKPGNGKTTRATYKCISHGNCSVRARISSLGAGFCVYLSGGEHLTSMHHHGFCCTDDMHSSTLSEGSNAY